MMATVDSKTSQQALDMILAAIGLRESDHKGSVTIQGKDPILASRHRFGELMAASQAAFGMALSELWQLRGGSPQSVTTSVRNAVHQHHGIALCVRTVGSFHSRTMGRVSASILP
jgi:hypothetical protein